VARSIEEFELVSSLLAENRNNCEISRLTGIPRETIRGWRWNIRDGKPHRRSRPSDQGCPGSHNLSRLPPKTYSYLLGMYLGDGCISRHDRGVWRLRIFNDSQYPGIIDECCCAIETLMPGQHAHRYKRPSRCVEISMYSKHWPCLFPQHGPGRKHNRPICLVPWQEKLVMEATESFLRGLMHSDGCRVIANDRGVMSVRYHFSNRSEDIKQLFCTSLDSLGIPWTRPDDRGIAIYRKEAVARLDRFIGAKQ
jgi:hypothetical protein